MHCLKLCMQFDELCMYSYILGAYYRRLCMPSQILRMHFRKWCMSSFGLYIYITGQGVSQSRVRRNSLGTQLRWTSPQSGQRGYVGDIGYGNTGIELIHTEQGVVFVLNKYYFFHYFFVFRQMCCNLGRLEKPNNCNYC